MINLKKSSLMLLSILAAAILTGCDKDAEDAFDLAGEWSGDMGMFYEYKHPYTQEYVSVDAARSDMRFVQYDDYEYSKSGWGEQVDYYNDPFIKTVYYRFLWRISNHKIYLTYIDDKGLSCVIEDYHVGRKTFGGVIGETRFLLNNLDHYNYRWNYYASYFNVGFYMEFTSPYYIRYEEYFYGKSQFGVTNPSDSVVAIKSIRHGSRYMNP